MKPILRITCVRYLGGHRIHIEFNSGEVGEVDLSMELDGPVFRPLRDPEFFAGFRLEGGTVSWPNGADLAPEYLAERLCAQQAHLSGPS